MPFLDLDIRTILRLLVIGNLVAMSMVFSYQNTKGNADPIRLFVLGKIFQAMGWFLLSMRGELPLWVSAHLGNPLLFIGFSFEITALGGLCQHRDTLKRLLVVWVAAGSLGFWMLGSTPALMVIVSGSVVAGIYGTGGLALLWAKRISHLQRLTALLFLLFFPILLIRVYYAYTEATSLMTLSKIQSVTFIGQFSLLLVGAIGFLLLLKEADDQRLQENARREQERRILQSRFIDMLTHELRAALSVIKLSGSSLSQQLVDRPPEVSKRLTNINRAADAMNSIIDRCLQLERLDQGEQPIALAPCSLRDIVAELRGLLDPNGARLRFAVPENASVMADHQLLGIMLGNLIDNALKYASPHSAILIDYSTEVAGGHTFGRIAVENFMLPGTAPAAEQMFVRYFRGARAHEFSGTGLGLYLVRTLARLQGGDAEYQVHPKGKVVLSIRLPAAANRLANKFSA
jgi:signal transduction histidine kinase